MADSDDKGGPAARPADGVEEEIDSEDAATAGRMADPVRAYLRSIGDIRLITREREVEIAKRIVEGRRMILSALAGSAVARRELAKLQAAVRGGSLALPDLFEDIGEEGLDDEAKAQLMKALGRTSRAWSLPWRPRIVAAVVARVRALVARASVIEDEIAAVQERSGMSQRELRRILTELRRSPRREQQITAKLGLRRAELERMDASLRAATRRLAALAVSEDVSLPTERRATRLIDDGERIVTQATGEMVRANLRLVVSI